MSKWFFEKELPGQRQDYKFGLKIKKEIFSGKSRYQKIEVLDSYALGRILVLDGIVQLSQKYEFIYHEMLAHLPLFSHPDPKRILIVGGGDGGILREVLKHSVKEVYFVEIDKKVLEISQKYFSFLKLAESLEDKRVKLRIEDGVIFIKRYKNFFDAIIVDSTDPGSFSGVLFKTIFGRASFNALTENGVFISQTGNWLDQSAKIKKVRKELRKIFPFVKIHRLGTPDYQPSEFSLALAPKNSSSRFNLNHLKKRFKKIKPSLRYYSPEVHLASGILPQYLADF